MYARPERTLPKLLTTGVPLALWAALIFVASGLPVWGPSDVQSAFEFKPVPDSFAFNWVEFRFHVGVFAVLGLLLYRFLCAWPVWSFRNICLMVLGLATAYALGDELHQAVVPGRTASFLDVGYDILGVLIVLTAMRLLARVSAVFGQRIPYQRHTRKGTASANPVKGENTNFLRPDLVRRLR